MADLPLIYDLLCDTSNLAADELLLSSVGELEPEYQGHALETLLKRQQPEALRQLVEQYHRLPDLCRRRSGNLFTGSCSCRRAFGPSSLRRPIQEAMVFRVRWNR